MCTQIQRNFLTTRFNRIKVSGQPTAQRRCSEIASILEISVVLAPSARRLQQMLWHRMRKICWKMNYRKGITFVIQKHLSILLLTARKFFNNLVWLRIFAPTKSCLNGKPTKCQQKNDGLKYSNIWISINWLNSFSAYRAHPLQ